MTAIQSIADFDAEHPQATFRGWLWTVTRSRIADHYRRRKGPRSAGGSSAQQQLNTIAETIPNEEPSQANDITRLLRRALDQIQTEFAENTWTMFWRAAVLAHPTDLIATEHAVTRATVRQAKSRVLRRLRRQLGDHV